MKYALIILIAAFLSQCVSYQKCKDKYGADTVVSYKDSLITLHDTLYLKADTLQGSTLADSLIYRPYIKETAKQKTIIKYVNGRIVYVNICKPDTVYFTKTKTIRIAKTVNNFQKASPKIGIVFGLAWLLLMVIIGFIIANFFSSNKKC